MDDGKGPHHPAHWDLGRVGRGKEKPERQQRCPEWQAWVAWLEECLERGGWDSLTQAATVKMTSDYGTELEKARLGIDQSTLSRWLNAVNLPQTNKVRTFVAALNESIARPVSDAELVEGLRLLARARKAVDLPAQRALVQTQKELVETFDGWSGWRAVHERLTGQLEEAKTMVERLKQLQRGFDVADAEARRLSAELAAAQRHVDKLEERLTDVENVLKNWQDRYNQAHAECETARESARDERLLMQDELSTARARAVLAEQERKKARKEVKALREALAKSQLALAMGPLANVFATSLAGARGGAEGNASPTPSAGTSPGPGSTASTEPHDPAAATTADARLGDSGGPTASPSTSSRRTPPSTPAVGGYRSPVPPPPPSAHYGSRPVSVYWESHITLTLLLAVLATSHLAESGTPLKFHGVARACSGGAQGFPRDGCRANRMAGRTGSYSPARAGWTMFSA
ncbi:hypothetical protein [Streptomyces collinus]|uniref:Uncharacterized protein n=1 Tax=Streptomyces collinus (strain DSM 40733 / Tue 365) TaxID=1214242 RepID=S5VF74_STRC3|nr:hypothetical protein [Streptomyces collinus]AGS73859.1 hypothetical protein B446_35503 [Streptomyces collinus Tu 365]